jgi:hypothetical protein
MTDVTMTSQACIGLYKKACTLPSIYIITPASLLHHAPPLRLHQDFMQRSNGSNWYLLRTQ